MSENNFEKFLKSKVSEDLHSRILKEAETELRAIRRAAFQKKLAVWFMPVVAVMASSFFLFKINVLPNLLNDKTSLPIQRIDETASNENLFKEDNLSETFELALDSADDEEVLEMTSELSLLEDMDAIENLSEEDLRG